ncbi:hypothetical protein, variant [Aphanomyces invadans]|uniref:GRIP domain-containing protein n=1 Tax=Aphanomyces invadans TaxID=157072 RepID=A0A024UIA9_9STRA|nr:hypothetical protein, variant [Aphanomyces invadans]ETW05612.1 hypothetical protein, variant [Aphanomyces invadans]|eukprot:XP_008865389.1 hypothetical protein, variant [Aphanomyces invadans]
MKSAFGMKNVKKENLEKGLADMKEIGIGGLSKGLNFLRTASQTAMAPSDEEKPAVAPTSSARASSFNGSSGVEKPKMSYDELLNLSMKLTKQNKAYKAQLTQASDKLFQAGEIEANYASLVQFVSEDVGVDLVYTELKVPPMTSDEDGAGSDSTSCPVEKLLDANAMRQLYHARDSARELQVRDMEDKYAQEIIELRAEVAKLSEKGGGDLINLDSPVHKTSTAPDSAVEPLLHELETLRTALDAERATVAESERAQQLLKSQLAEIQGLLMTTTTSMNAHASDMAAQKAALQSKDDIIAGLKHELAQQQQIILKLQDKTRELGSMSQRVQLLEQENAAHVKDIHQMQATIATHASDVEAWEAKEAADRAVKAALDAYAVEISMLRATADAQAIQLSQAQSALAEHQTTLAAAHESRLAQEAHDQALLLERQNALDAIQAQLHVVEATASNLRTEREAGLSEIKSLEYKVRELTAAIESKERQVVDLETSVQRQTAALAEALAKAEDVSMQWQSEVASLRHQVHQVNVVLSQRQDDLDSVKSQLVAAQQAVAADASEKVAMLQQEVTLEQKKVEEITAALHAKDTQVSELEARLGDLERVHIHVNEALRQAEVEKAEAAARLTDVITAHSCETERVISLQKSLEHLQADFASVTAVKIAVESELGQLKEAVQSDLAARQRDVAVLQEAVVAHERQEASLHQTTSDALAAKASIEAQVVQLEEAMAAAMARATQAEEDKVAEVTRLQCELDDARAGALALAETNKANVDAQIECLRQDAAAERKRVVALQAQLDAEAQERELERAKHAAQVEESQKHLVQSRDELIQVQAQLGVATTTIQAYAADLEAHAETIKEKEARLLALQENLDAQNARLADCHRKDEEVSQLQAKLHSVEQQAAAHVAAIDALQQQVTTHQTDLASVQAAAETAATMKASLEGELQVMETLRAQIEAKTADLHDAHAQLQSYHNERSKERESWEKQLREAEATAAKLQAELETAQAQLAAAQSMADTYAQDIKNQVNAAREREDYMATLKQELHLAQATLGQRLHHVEAEASALAAQLSAAELKSRTTELRAANEATEAARAAKANVEAELHDTRLTATKTLEAEVERLTLKWKEMEAAWTAQKSENGRLAKEMHTLHKTWSEKNALAARLHAENVLLSETSAGITAEAAQLRQQLTEHAEALRKSEGLAKEMTNVAASRASDVTRVETELAEATASHARWKEDWHEKLRLVELTAAEREAKLNQKFAIELEKLEADGRAKSKLARQVVLEKEELIASLTAKLAKLEEDVRSGDADHRRIFELASMQANRDAAARSREQELAEVMTALEQLRAENVQLTNDKVALEEDIAHLVRTERREGVNMEYLKNVVVQYMSFRPGSSQQLKLIPVLSTLLQFTPEDMDEVHSSTKQASSWTSWSEKKPVRNITAPPPIVIPQRKKVGSPRSLNSPSKSSSPRSSPRGSPRSKTRRSMSPPKQRAMTAQEPLAHHDSIDL